ncbi:MAG: HAD family hydrolase [Gordonibacter sp.]
MPLKGADCTTDETQAAPATRVQLAVFDFDGTSICGNSPVMLVWYLRRRHLLRKSVVLRILVWAAAYKLRLPQNESSVRSLVFTAFEGKPAAEVDRFLAGFYDECVAPRFRPQADAAMRAHTQAGEVVLVISATFEPIILQAMQHHPFMHQISTRMRIAPDGTYTREVEGLPVEGEQKLDAVKHFGDEHYGPGNWELAAAYGDHHSDRAVLAAARRAFAVNPDRPLMRTARKRNWDVVAW